MADGNIIQSVVQAVETEGIRKIDKCLVYAPDAIGTHFFQKYSSLFEKVLKHTSLNVSLCSVYPPKTPVCFASMFTGGLPESHGIMAYERPVLQCDTIFDALIRDGKKVAIVAVANSSIDLIFRDRKIDYYSEKYDEQVTKRTIELLESDKHDFILAYHQEYDDTLHKTTPQSERAIQAVKRHIDSFDRIGSAFELHWKHYNRIIMFAPDHGAHIDSDSQKGSHGENIPEDMRIQHFIGIGNSSHEK